MTQLEKLKLLLGSPSVSDEVLQFYLDNASDIICEFRNTDGVETAYLTAQLKMAIEMYSKRGAEGQVGHTENEIERVYEASDLSPSLLAQITPVVRTPYSEVRTVS